MPATYHHGLHRYSLVLLACTFLLLIAGALVTSNDAALAVPDWPLSYGTLTPPMVGGIFYEHSHRVIAAAIGFLMILLAVWTWRAESRRWVRWLSLAALGAVILQGVLGGLTVLLNLHYGMPIAHACLAQIFFGAIMGMALFTSRWWISEQPAIPDSGSPSIHTFALVNAAAVFLQVILGAGFRHKSMPIWPHIIGAFVVAATITWTALTLRHRFGNVREMKLARILINAVFGLQFMLGVAAWASRLMTVDAPQPLPAVVALTVIHTVTGALTFACSLLVVMLCYRMVPRSREAALAPARTGAAIS
jgi:cytochrome c oxidase assembly protein subunit 15